MKIIKIINFYTSQQYYKTAKNCGEVVKNTLGCNFYDFTMTNFFDPWEGFKTKP